LDTIENEEHKAVFADVENMKKLKERFIRFSTEEILRRNANQEDELNTEINLGQ